LLIDVEGGSPGFKTDLIYDVSRWGRFQDADGSAYYEYVCRRSGVEIRYSNEQFENDGSVVSTIVKTSSAPWPVNTAASCRPKYSPASVG
jgi:hypothetical protein